MHGVDDEFEEVAKTWYNLTSGENLTSYFMTIYMYNHTLPVFVRSGSILAFFSRVGRNMEETRRGQLKLIVARGPNHLCDGISFNYQKSGEFMNRNIVYENNKIRIK